MYLKETCDNNKKLSLKNQRENKVNLVFEDQLIYNIF